MTYFKGIFLGGFLTVALGDGEDDTEQLMGMYEALSIITGLMLSYYYSMFQEAASKVMTINENAPGLGSVSFTIVSVSFLTAMASICNTIIALVVLKNVISVEHFTYILHHASFTLRQPWILWAVSIQLQFVGFVVEVIIRVLEYDVVRPNAMGTRQAPTDEAYATVAIFGVLFLAAFLFGIYNMSVLVWAFKRGHDLFCGAPPSEKLVAICESTNAAGTAAGTSCADSTPPPPWFADLSRAQAAHLLDEYLASQRHHYRNPVPAHFLKFCVRTVQDHGHRQISYVGARICESVFEEWLQRRMSASAQEGVGGGGTDAAAEEVAVTLMSPRRSERDEQWNM